MNHLSKQLLIIVFHVGLFVPTMIWGQWIRQDTPADITILLTVDFVSQEAGAAGGWSLPSQFSGRAIYTTDGGSTWSMAQIPDSSRSLVRLQFVDGDSGYMVGAYNVSQRGSVLKRKPINSIPSFTSGNLIEAGRFFMGISMDPADNYRGLFLKTTDGGRNWFTKGSLPDSIFYLIGSSFLNMNLGYVTGTTTLNGGGACVLKTTDGGDSWITLTIPDSIYELRAVSFRDSLNGVAVGYTMTLPSLTGIILRTTDGGVDWQVQSFPEVSNFRDVSYIDSLVCLAVGGYNSIIVPQNGAIYSSTDAGSHWSPLTYSPETSYLTGISFMKGTGTGIIFGAKMSEPWVPFITRTTNFGVTWTETVLPDDSMGVLYGGKIITPLNGYACGTADSGMGTGYMTHTDNGGLVDVREIEDRYPLNNSLLQNYPNPFNPSTQITFSLPTTGSVTIRVYDVLGNEIATLIDERMEAGVHQALWNAKGSPSGVYFYRIVSTGFTETRKMVLMN